MIAIRYCRALSRDAEFSWLGGEGWGKVKELSSDGQCGNYTGYLICSHFSLFC